MFDNQVKYDVKYTLPKLKSLKIKRANPTAD